MILLVFRTSGLIHTEFLALTDIAKNGYTTLFIAMSADAKKLDVKEASNPQSKGGVTTQLSPLENRLEIHCFQMLG